jgi:F-type H+-transporting ATPase subunit b
MPMAAVLSGGSVVDLDATVLFQLAAFLLLFVVLRSLLFKPMAALLQERERCTEGDVKEAHRRQAEAEQKMAEYARKLDRIRAKASEEREVLRAEGRTREQEVLAAARREAADLIQKGRESMTRQVAQAREVLDRDIQTLGREIAGRILGRKPN